MEPYGSIFAVHVGTLPDGQCFGHLWSYLTGFRLRNRTCFMAVISATIGADFACAAISWHGVGHRAVRSPASRAITKAPIARLVQPAVPQKDKWNRQKRPMHLADLINLSQAGENKPDIVIWPETAFAGLPAKSSVT